MFYLANSYMCLKQYEDAIRWYKERIAKGGWIEEIWYSKYMIGDCYAEMNQWDQALSHYLEAYQLNPERAETLQQISKHYRLSQQNELAYLFAKQGLTIPYPSNQALFISHPTYDYLLEEDLSVAAYYTSHKDEGFASTNRLMLKKDIPDHVKYKAYENLLYYIQPLNNAIYKAIKITLPPIREGLIGTYNPMNPSIQKTDKGYNLICRTVNYTQIGARHFKSMDLLDSTIRTRNYFVTYDKNFNLLSQQEIVENLPRKRKPNCGVEGLEDCRLLELDNSIWFTCTTRDTNFIGMPQVSLCKLSDDRSGSTIAVDKLIPLSGPDENRCEKNWLPFVKDKEFHYIYSYSPFIICKPNIKTKGSANWPEPLRNEAQKHDLSHFSGSASPIKFDDGYLMLVHEVVHGEGRTYVHRFAFLDRDFIITKVSKPFIYMHKGIEYCCGMTLDHSEKNLIMTIGIEDREAYLSIVDVDTVRSLLEPLL